MKNMHWFSTLSVVCSLASIALFQNDFVTASYFTALVGVLIFLPDMMKYTRALDFLASWLAMIVLTTEMYFVNPYIIIPLVLAQISLFIRFHLFEIMGYTRFMGLEILIALTALLSLVAVNMLGTASWEFWAIPGVLIALSILLNSNVKGTKILQAKTMEGYAAEIGKQAPDFSLPDEEGTVVSLNHFIGKKNLLLIFVKGDWCPGCHMMLRCYEKNREKFQEKDIVVMAIGPDPIGTNKEMVKKLGLEYKVLSDEQYTVVNKYGISVNGFPGAPKEQETTPLPASFLVDKSGVLRYTSRPDRAGEFLNPALIFNVIEKLSPAA